MEYQININISPVGLQNIYDTGQAVAVFKEVQAMVEGVFTYKNLTPAVCWLQIQPLQHNQVAWNSDYYLYATTTPLQLGSKIIMNSTSDKPVQDGWTYTFARGFFSGCSGKSGNYSINNQMNNYSYSFGLGQKAVINNVSLLAPLNASPVLYNEQAFFIPRETISIFLVSYIDNGVIIGQVASNTLTFSLNSQNSTVGIGFNHSKNTFYLEEI
jgi:hypothetical protein